MEASTVIKAGPLIMHTPWMKRQRHRVCALPEVIQQGGEAVGSGAEGHHTMGGEGDTSLPLFTHTGPRDSVLVDRMCSVANTSCIVGFWTLGLAGCTFVYSLIKAAG